MKLISLVLVLVCAAGLAAAAARLEPKPEVRQLGIPGTGPFGSILDTISSLPQKWIHSLKSIFGNLWKLQHLDTTKNLAEADKTISDNSGQHQKLLPVIHQSAIDGGNSDGGETRTEKIPEISKSSTLETLDAINQITIDFARKLIGESGNQSGESRCKSLELASKTLADYPLADADSLLAVLGDEEKNGDKSPAQIAPLLQHLKKIISQINSKIVPEIRAQLRQASNQNECLDRARESLQAQLSEQLAEIRKVTGKHKSWKPGFNPSIDDYKVAIRALEAPPKV